MKHIKTLNTRNLCESAKKGGCGECQTSCEVINRVITYAAFRRHFMLSEKENDSSLSSGRLVYRH